MIPPTPLDLAQYPDMAPFVEQVRGLRSPGGFFQADKPILLARAPGRLDLMGGNDDYTGGLVFETTIREATRVAVQARDDDFVALYNPDVASQGWQTAVRFSLHDLYGASGPRPLEEVRAWINADPARQWIAYIAGAFYWLKEKYRDRVTHGLSLYLQSDVPLGKGVSSSAALEVAPMKAAAFAYGVNLAGPELALACQWVENAIAQSASGVMDQITVVLGDREHFVPLLCQPCEPEPLVRLGRPMRIWGIDSGVRHSVAGIEYEAARAATFVGYRLICDWEGLTLSYDESGALPRWTEPRWNGYLANLSPSLYHARYEARLPQYMSGAEFLGTGCQHIDPFTPVRPYVQYPVRACTRYAVEENYRVHLFVELLANRREPLSPRALAQLGELMYQSHVAYSECGLGSEATDLIVDLVRSEGPANGLYGAKITGGGAGGTVAVLGTTEPEAEAAFRRVVEKYSSETGRVPYIFEGSSPGADAFGVQSPF